MQVGLHHHHQRKNKVKTPPKKNPIALFIDSVVYIGGFAGVVFLIPQVAQVWVHHQVSGLSLISWLSFTGGAAFWILYGVIHKAMPILIINIGMFILYFTVALGIVVFGPRPF